MADTYTLIEKITVGAAGATDVTFTSIPQTYTDLKLVWSGRQGVASAIKIQFNGDTSTANYSQRRIYGSGTSAVSDNSSILGYFNPIGLNNGNSTASVFSNSELYIPNYTGSTNKSISADTVTEDNSTSASYQFATLAAGIWSQTAAITSITMTPGGGSFAQYSTFYLYGIAKEGVSPAPSSAPYATGGDKILYDGTYWYHAFTSTGTFTPKKGLSCDVLVAAGGGAGGTGGGAGGGGAGGFRVINQSVANATSYTVTIGAGGTTNAGGVPGGSGSNSSFIGGAASITSSGGGGGGTAGGNGANGGSGGGAGHAPANGGTGNAGSYSPSEGSDGGGAGAASGFYAAGGGGGLSAAGAAGNSAVGGGNGGNGSSAYSSWGSATSTGQNVSGTYWYAGGGGGGVFGAGTLGTGGNGGGGTSAVAGTANTGGGGGGGSLSPTRNPGNGGSGIVIVRYAA